MRRDLTPLLDLEAADVKKWTPEGKFTFHGFRNQFISAVIQGGADLKESMDLARHVSASMTLDTYARSKPQRLRDLAERVGESARVVPDHVTSVQLRAVGDEGQAEKDNAFAMIAARAAENSGGFNSLPRRQ